jgi:large subunit ribosomal protein L6
VSRVGKIPVEVPAGVEVQFAGNKVTVKGKLGALTTDLGDQVRIKLDQGKVTFEPANDSRQASIMWGTARNIVRNMVQGVSKGYSRALEINGVGYRAAIQGKNLVLQLGFSHDIEYPIPADVTIKCEKPTSILVSGADKQRVGQVAAEIRAFRGPEPYKGKGIKYDREVIRRKEGKKK